MTSLSAQLLPWSIDPGNSSLEFEAVYFRAALSTACLSYGLPPAMDFTGDLEGERESGSTCAWFSTPDLHIPSSGVPVYTQGELCVTMEEGEEGEELLELS